MPRPRLLAILAVLTTIHACSRPAVSPSPVVHRHPQAVTTVSRIAVGSCLQQRRPAPALAAMAAGNPDLVLLLGDNVYADTDDPVRMRTAYAELAANPDYRRLAAAAPILAVWDDHDYGANDAGAEWAFKHDAKRILLDFFGESPGSPRRQRDGVYEAWVFGPPGRRLQVILLDTRWYRSPLRRERGGYVPVTDASATILGETQWAWLESQLAVPADVRIVGSSIQVLPDEHPFEKWANIPHERERLLRTLAAAEATAVVVVSGDRHRGELSVLRGTGAGLRGILYELTASSLNAPIPATEPNRFRDGPLVGEANFGTIEIAWEDGPARTILRLHGADGRELVERSVPLGG